MTDVPGGPDNPLDTAFVGVPASAAVSASIGFGGVPAGAAVSAAAVCAAQQLVTDVLMHVSFIIQGLLGVTWSWGAAGNVGIADSQ